MDPLCTSFTPNLWERNGFLRCACCSVVNVFFLLNALSFSFDLSRDVAWKVNSCKFAPFLPFQNSRLLWRIERFKPLINILLKAYSSYTSPQQKVFATNASAYWDSVIPDGCVKRAISDSVFAMTLLVAYFFSKKLATSGYVVNYLVLPFADQL